MTRFTTSRSLVLGCALVALGVYCLAQEPTREKDSPAPDKGGRQLKVPESSPDSNSAEQLWKQIGQLHRQIVALEIQAPRIGAVSTQLNVPATSGRVNDDVLLGDPLRPEDALKPVQPGGLVTTALSSEGLWMQIAQLHKQIVQMETADTPARTERAFRGENEAEKKGDAGAPESKAPATSEANDSTPERGGTQPGADAHRSSIEQLWSRIAELQQQIVAQEVKDVKSRKAGPQENTAPARESSPPIEN